ncbi:MAG: alpha-galactosidase [Planctomycetota bacterium]|nr:alpha-galactosidase [Planctomycetota bacterium]
MPSTPLADCVIRLAGDAPAASELVIANAHFERRWRIDNGLLYATSLLDRAANAHSDVQWISEPVKLPAPYPASPVPDEPRVCAFSLESGQATPWEEPSLRATLTATGRTLTLTYRFQLFPGASGVSIQLEAAASASAKPTTNATKSAAGKAADASAAGVPVEAPPSKGGGDKPILDALEHFVSAAPHLRLTQVSFRDRSDHHNELVAENTWLLHPSEAGLQLAGNLFVLHDNLRDAGLIFLKEAPLPHVRPAPNPVDFHVLPEWIGPWRWAFLGHGNGAPASGSTPDTLVAGPGYRWIVLTYSGGSGGRAGCTAALQAYQRHLRRYTPGQDARFLVNYWGDRSRDVVVNDAFYRKEVDAAADLGGDVLQIDSGWHRGRLADNVNGKNIYDNFRGEDPNFWDLDKNRFPHGLEPIIAQAKARGLAFGLWFAPDSGDDFARWREDADRMLELHRTLGVTYFKIDYMAIRSRLAERRFHQMVDAVREDTAGAVTFDMDITAGERPGYFGQMSLGPLFVENRYTDWHRYWPHHTLRNLWKLSPWVDPRRLRLELLNNTRNPQRYPDDPLAPARYSPAYLFASVMFAQPLGWFEAQNLPLEYRAEVAALVKVWRHHRDAIFAGTILPLGDEPDGLSWTGLASLSPAPGSGGTGYLLLFRETHNAPDWAGQLPALPGLEIAKHPVCTVLAGHGTIALRGQTIEASIPHQRQFLFARIEY